MWSIFFTFNNEYSRIDFHLISWYDTSKRSSKWIYRFNEIFDKNWILFSHSGQHYVTNTNDKFTFIEMWPNVTLQCACPWQINIHEYWVINYPWHTSKRNFIAWAIVLVWTWLIWPCGWPWPWSNGIDILGYLSIANRRNRRYTYGLDNVFQLAAGVICKIYHSCCIKYITFDFCTILIHCLLKISFKTTQEVDFILTCIYVFLQTEVNLCEYVT